MKDLQKGLGLLILRVSTAGLMLLHGAAKIRKGTDAIKQMLADKGLPELLATGVYVGEIVCPPLMIVGLFTRTSAWIFAINMLVAIVLAHSGDVGSLNQFGGWAIELPVLYLVGGVAVALLGPGRFAIHGEPRRTASVAD